MPWFIDQLCIARLIGVRDIFKGFKETKKQTLMVFRLLLNRKHTNPINGKFIAGFSIMPLEGNQLLVIRIYALVLLGVYLFFITVFLE